MKNEFHSFAVYLMICAYIYALLEKKYMCVNIARSTSESYLNFRSGVCMMKNFMKTKLEKQK